MVINMPVFFLKQIELKSINKHYRKISPAVYIQHPLDITCGQAIWWKIWHGQCIYRLWDLFFNSLALTLFCKSSSLLQGSIWRPSSLSSSGGLTMSQKNRETSKPPGFVRCIKSMTTPEEQQNIGYKLSISKTVIFPFYSAYLSL